MKTLEFYVDLTVVCEDMFQTATSVNRARVTHVLEMFMTVCNM